MTLEDFKKNIDDNMALMAYISTTNCNVCKALRPKIESMVEQEFPEMRFIYIESNKFPDVAAQYSVFTVPTILVFFDRKETIRKSRFIGVQELADEIRRSYEIIFS